jgi:hypothetical protein
MAPCYVRAMSVLKHRRRWTRTTGITRRVRPEVVNVRRARFVVAVAIVLGVSACGGLRRPGFPRQSFDEDRQIRTLEQIFDEPSMLRDYYDPAKTPASAQREGRDRIIAGRIALIDLNYNQFVSQATANKQFWDTAVDIALLATSIAGTAAGGEGAKTVLAAAAAGLAGSKTAIDKNFFYEQTVPVLVASMNAQRKVALIPLHDGAKLDVTEYPLTRALSDLNNYYFAGTFLGALQAIQADAGAKERAADIRLSREVTTVSTSVALQASVEQLLDRIAALSDEQAIALATNLPVQDPEVDNLIAQFDPQGRRLSRGGAAKQVLRRVVIYTDREKPASLAAWAAALPAK